MTASILCMIAERRGAPYADAQYWGRYGRCIVKGYPPLPLTEYVINYSDSGSLSFAETKV